MSGLSDKEVIINREKYGSNEINNTKSKTFLKLFFDALSDPIIKILIIALFVKIVFLFKDFDWYETIGILIAIFLASFLSSLSEYSSEKSFKKLQEESSKINCKVIRNGKIKEIFIDDVVVDDLVVLEVGDKIPSDGIIISGDIVVDESSLTGEIKEVNKKINDKLFRGSTIYQKKCIMKTMYVGNNTYYGKISKELHESSPDSPLKNRLRELAKTISKIGYIGALLGSFSYLFSSIVIDNNFDIVVIKEIIFNYKLMIDYLIHAITIAVTIIIVSVPEGLPMMITLVLSSNMKRMLKKNVLVRKMVGIETSGSMNILFFDKTGTITKGKPVVTCFIDHELNKYNRTNLHLAINYRKILNGLIVNNESTFDDNFNIIGGNITDKTILEFTKNIKFNNTCTVLEQEVFDSSKKYSKTIILDNDKKISLIKGAPEIIFNKCNCYYKDNKKHVLFNKNKIWDYINYYIKNGNRVLCLAEEDIDVALIGFVIINDEIRDEAKKEISLIRNAGIHQIMITGDNIDTAYYIAKEIGLISSNNDIIMTSSELNKMSDDEIKNKLFNIKVLARLLPTDKSRLVKIAQSMNLVVGMTGDGANDALALKKADVGFSMGSGTEVAKEASDIVLLDDNISSISHAVLFGRTIFKSIRKFIIFQLTLNICALLVSIVGPLIGINTPITVMQMLWINMIMDTLAGFAFSYEAPLDEYMKELPKKKDEKIINKYMINEICVASFYTAILSLFFLKSKTIYNFFRISDNNEYLFTAFFGFLIFIGIFNSFNARTNRINILADILENKVFLTTFILIIIIQFFLIYFGGDVFRTFGLNFKELQIMLLLSFSIVPVDIIRKIILKKNNKNTGV